MAVVPGTRIGPYDVIAPIGAGGMGEVYRARDTRLHRDVTGLMDEMRVSPDGRWVAYNTDESGR